MHDWSGDVRFAEQFVMEIDSAMPMIDIDWLKDHVEVPEGLTYEQLARTCQVGLEGGFTLSQVISPIVVGARGRPAPDAEHETIS